MTQVAGRQAARAAGTLRQRLINGLLPTENAEAQGRQGARRRACLLRLLRRRRHLLQLLLQLLGARALRHQLLHDRHEVVALRQGRVLLGLQGKGMGRAGVWGVGGWVSV